MTKPLSALGPGNIDPRRMAMFLDFDGTLVEIAEHPNLVEMQSDTGGALKRLHTCFGGALAVITGRDIDDVDRFLKPLHLPVAGVHGLERRRTDGSVYTRPFDGRAITLLGKRLRPLLRDSDGLLLETKSGSIALHYRARPDLERSCIRAMDAAVRGLEGIHLIRGKMVIEAKADFSDKGGAITAFLAEPPFAGRTPFFAGDDVTDEDGFEAVNALQGISVKVGPGRTRAHYRADDTPAFLVWLRSMVGNIERMHSIEQP